MLKVQQTSENNTQRFGAEKTRVILVGNSTHDGTKKLVAIMQELGLRSIRTEAKR